MENMFDNFEPFQIAGFLEKYLHPLCQKQIFGLNDFYDVCRTIDISLYMQGFQIPAQKRGPQ